MHGDDRAPSTGRAATRPFSELFPWLFASALLLLSVPLAAHLTDLPAPDGVVVSWPVAALFIALVRALPVHVHVAGETRSFQLTEIPIIVGLFVVAPFGLVLANVVGGVVHRLLLRRQRPVKHVMNLALDVVDVVVAVSLFNLLAPQGDAVIDNASLLSAVAAVAAASFTTGVSLWVVLSVVTGRFDPAALREVLLLAVPVSTLAAATGVSIVVMLTLQPTLLWVMVAPLLALVLGSRRYLAERYHRQALLLLHDLARDVHTAGDLPRSLGSLASTLAHHVRAGRVEIYVRDPQHAERPLRLVARPGTTADAFELVSEVPADVLSAWERHGTLVVRRFGRGRQRLTVGADAGAGRDVAFRATEPLGDVGFGGYAVALLQAAVLHVAVLFEDERVHVAKNAFLSAVSHELRTPLSVILGTSETLQQRGTQLPPSIFAELTVRLWEQAQRLDGLLRDLLDVDRISHGLLDARREPTDVAEVVREVVGSMSVRTHDVELRMGALPASVDVPQVERIVENLVRNATKYAPAGSRVLIEAFREDGLVTIAVADEGPGVPDADKRRVFSPFTRLQHDHPSPGTGVGLSLVEQFARLHGGSVRVEDRPEGGARFVVELADPDGYRSSQGTGEAEPSSRLSRETDHSVGGGSSVEM